MSILLEALKKSEEQRQLGTAPDIHGSVDHKPGRDGSGQPWVPLVLVVVALLAMSWFGWKQYQRPEGLVETAAIAPVEEVGEPAAVVRDEAVEKASRTPVESFAASGDDSQDSAEPQSGKAPLVDQRREELSRSFSEYQPDSGDEQAERITTDADQATSQAGQEGVPDEPGADAATAVAESAPPLRRLEQPAALEPHISQPISYWELPQNVRNGLPELRITVLVYAETPSDRFALINGQRMVEGDDLGSGVTLREIRREGAVFSYRNYRFLVKG